MFFKDAILGHHNFCLWCSPRGTPPCSQLLSSKAPVERHLDPPTSDLNRRKFALKSKQPPALQTTKHHPSATLHNFMHHDKLLTAAK
ncbi:hypothetical protein I7I50_03540 [Histoplasma capsulatum G186AR]|uniref:Uncharacterized protein n=1 Tax=Ajellomyces capsulatus TaxID=5037 RepID=A0A8H7YND2_AJECA|nr:hypothetical protein I7I52_04447 [Histoplasma capsulatum]QSS74663.1 hypothetical protein I7I50_03540 [Histoplasma capsulatum G186AR]